ncbi:putative NlpC/P60 family protein [Nocardia nova SH22a]|uniref:Putative NlpC/P60 family protein n=1 Tax=Nocardia nova SH22a TaxID=1415166 RepID=W5TAQ7_9NOCA|nr:C40 family peptidase [Nocardia nova]AHH16410.1 putative NlpC/P60 family protein [Nocardia nova SH22a]
MSAQLTAGVDGVLNSLLGLYGNGQPAQGRAAAAVSGLSGDDGRVGKLAAGYREVAGMHTSVADGHAERDAVVHKSVTAAGDGIVSGRGVVNGQIADLQSRMQAIAKVGDLRFSGPALLDAAHAAVTNATRQVDADVEQARRHAAQIVPPAAPKAVRGRVTANPGRRRRRIRPRSVSRATRASRALPAVHRPVPSDGTHGGRAVSAASAYLGLPYVWGGGGAGGPSGGGFDCSGLTQYAVSQATDGKVVLPRTTYEQIYSGVRIPPQDVRPGDLVFPADSFSSRGPEHVQLAAGNGMVIEAPHSGSTVKWSPMPSAAVVVRVM